MVERSPMIELEELQREAAAMKAPDGHEDDLAEMQRGLADTREGFIALEQIEGVQDRQSSAGGGALPRLGAERVLLDEKERDLAQVSASHDKWEAAVRESSRRDKATVLVLISAANLRLARWNYDRAKAAYERKWGAMGFRA